MSFAPVGILGSGMITGVGLDAEASCAAIRGRIDGFRESVFVSANGDPLVSAEIPRDDLGWGADRLASLLAIVLRQCVDQVPDTDTATIPVLVCLPEEDRPGRLQDLGNPLFHRACELLGAAFHAESRLLPHGRVAGAMALFAASDLLRQGAFDYVIVAGVDSYLNAVTLRHYFDEFRLLAPERSNGFIPGEAAGAILIGSPGLGGIECRALGFAMEPTPISESQPLRGDGLHAAITEALQAAQCDWESINLRIADVSGEHYRFREAAIAMMRSLRTHKEELDMWHPADCIGEIGAAALPVMLGVALDAKQKGYAPEGHILLHLSNDDGRRAAMVLSQ
ncbi:MAG: hypothetical protein AAFY56_08825 [Pseudomonadota bacterium]